MEQDSFVYSFVARGTTVVAEYAAVTGNFPAVATKCLQGLPSSDKQFRYNLDHHFFNFLFKDGYAYCVVAKESVENHLSLAFLEKMKEYFKKRYGAGTEADTAAAKSLDNEFGPIMKEQMQYIVDHAEEIGKQAKVKNAVLDNIVKAQEFRKTGDQVTQYMWYNNMNVKLIVIGILVLLVFVIWLSICRGFHCIKSTGS